ncbi:MAG: response regulator [Candidatus Sumerlaeia bacterium]
MPLTERIRVLLVEDNEDDAFLLSDHISRTEPKIRLDIQPNLKAAIAAMDSENYNAVILDLGLPESSGLETLSSFRSQCQDAPVVVLTGLEGDEIGLAAVKSGAQDYIPKSQISGALVCRSIRYAIERKAAEDNRLKLESRIQEAEKLESLGMLAGGVAHDFNNLLQSIIGNVELAKTRFSPENGVWRNLEQIESSAHRASELTQQMLAYSGKGQFLIQKIAICELVKNMQAIIEDIAGPNASIHYDLCQKDCYMHGDPAQIRQIIRNLVENAVEAAPEDGKSDCHISIRAYSRDFDETELKHCLTFARLLPGKYVALEVQDLGLGMKAETQKRIFEPFFTSKFAGRGLGLAAVAGIVRGHKGAISVKSAPGKGSSFTILFPPETPVELESNQSYMESSHGDTGAILLIDDEEIIRVVGESMLEDMGYECILAASGPEGIEKFRLQRKKIDCIILDLTMPGMHGEEAFGKIREMDSNVPIILSSGFSRESIADRLSGMRLAGFLKKPYTYKLLQNAVQNVLCKEDLKSGVLPVEP